MLDFHKLAEESSYIDSFDEYEKNKFKIITSVKKIMMKKLFINTNLIYKINKEKGMMQIISDPNIKMGENGCNLILDCKARVIKRSETLTTMAVKVKCEVDFGLSKVFNKTIHSQVEKELKKVINKGIEKYNKE